MNKLCKKKTEKYFDNYKFFDKISEIPKEVFQKQYINNPYLSYNFLSAIEDNNKEFIFLYIVLFKHNDIVGFAMSQILNVSLDNPISFTSSCRISEEIISIVKKHSQKKPIKILVSGNIFISGENGYIFSENEDKSKCVYEFTKILEQIVGKIKKEQTIKIVLFKDFFSDNSTNRISFDKSDYRLFSTEPEMILTINPEWIGFSDYLQALKSKYRTKAKKAIKESNVLDIKDFSAIEIEKNIDRLNELYINVESKASFSLGKMNLETYIDLKTNFPDNFILKTYSFEGKIVGFMSAFVNIESIDAHYVGIDYEYNRKYYIYQKMLYDYANIAIQKKLKRVNYGRSAGEIKSTVGAEPHELICFVKHMYFMQNTFLKPISLIVKPTGFKQIIPFK